MKARNKLFLIVFTCLLVLCGGGFMVYEMVAMGINQKVVLSQSQDSAENSPTTAQTSLMQKLFMDLDKPSTDSTSTSNTDAVPATSGASASLHFANREQAIQYALKKFSPVELATLMSDLSHPDQLTSAQIQDLESILKSKFSHSEIVALKEVLDRQ